MKFITIIILIIRNGIHSFFSYLYSLYSYIVMQKKILSWLLLFLCIGFVACQDTDYPGPVNPGGGGEGEVPGGDTLIGRPDTCTRTVLIYMAADNSLSSYGYENINLMLKGMKNNCGRLVIYFDAANEEPRLLTIKGAMKPVLDTLKTYKEENSASTEVFGRVIKDVRELYPSESYGLILWSHGMGWLPPNFSFPRNYYTLPLLRDMPPTKYFAEDKHCGDKSGSEYIEIEDLAAAITDKFSFILFDACFMSSVEVLYGLKEKATYIISSPAEVIANGFPYDKIAPYLWGGKNDMIRVCKEFFEFYRNHPNGRDWCSATVALIETGELDSLAANVRTILEQEIIPLAAQQMPAVWRYPLSQYYLPDVFYDLGDYIRAVATEEQYTLFSEQLEKTVVYKASTPTFFGYNIPEDKFSGISIYIPQEKWETMNKVYAELSWAKAIYGLSDNP